MVTTASTDQRLPLELLVEIASKLTEASDISKFSRCNRMSHDFITPLLFRHIAVSIVDDISAVADAFRNKPHLAAHCRSLSLLNLDYYIPSDSENDDEEDEEELKVKFEEAQNAIYDDLANVLEILGSEGRLEVFSFPPRDEYDTIVIPTRVWRALGGLSGSLVELDLTVLEPERDTWTAFCTSTFSKLRTFRLNLRKAHGWDCAPLQRMFHGLKDLENLYLTFPSCCGPGGINMSSSHPRLRTFYLSTEIFPDASNSFIRRHPTIEKLSFHNVRRYVGLDQSDLPHLRSLCIDQTSILSNSAMLPTTSQRPLTHVRLEYMPVLSTYMVFERLAPIRTTLRHLEFQWNVGGFRVSIPFFGKLLVLLPCVKKLVIELTNIHSIPPHTDTLAADDLSNLLLSIAECTSIFNLRLSYPGGSELPQSLLDDMGVVPESLRHLCWDVQERAIMYRIDTSEGKTMAVKTDLGRLFPDDDSEDDEFASWLAPVWQ